MMNGTIVTMGLRASGKTTTTRTIAENIGIESMDLDEAIIQHLQKKYGKHITINDFVNKICGGSWGRFRYIENLICEKIINEYKLVSLGGGTPAFEDNRALIDSKESVKILLDISLEEQIRRLEGDDEGNKNRPDLGQGLSEIYGKRIDIYREFANHIISVDGKSIEDIRDEILGIPEIEDAFKRAI